MGVESVDALGEIMGVIRFVNAQLTLGNDLNNMPVNSYSASNNASSLLNSPVPGRPNAWACFNLTNDATQKKLFIDIEGGKIYTKYATTDWQQVHNS